MQLSQSVTSFEFSCSVCVEGLTIGMKLVRLRDVVLYILWGVRDRVELWKDWLVISWKLKNEKFARVEGPSSLRSGIKMSSPWLVLSYQKWPSRPFHWHSTFPDFSSKWSWPSRVRPIQPVSNTVVLSQARVSWARGAANSYNSLICNLFYHHGVAPNNYLAELDLGYREPQKVEKHFSNSVAVVTSKNVKRVNLSDFWHHLRNVSLLLLLRPSRFILLLMIFPSHFLFTQI